MRTTGTQTEPLWTLAELSARVERALATGGYEAPENGQVRAVPNERTIRYYTTLGLIDRPAQMRGRTAYYSRRHLLQLVAIKRMQARGLPLNRIQARLTGLSNTVLADIAHLPKDLDLSSPSRALEAEPEPGDETVSRRGSAFWDVQPAPVPAPKTAAPAPRVQGLPLSDEAILLLTNARALTAEDLAAIGAAAGPLLETLRARGLWEEGGRQ